MFGKLKDAYDKYVLMDKRFDELEKTVNSLTKEIKEIKKQLEVKEQELPIDAPRPGEICPTCGKATVRTYVDRKTEMICTNYVDNTMSPHTFQTKTKKCTSPECNYEEEI